MLAPWRRPGRSAQGYRGDERLTILDLCEQITFVTLWIDPGVLRERLKAKITLLCKSLLPRPGDLAQRLRWGVRMIQILRLSANVSGLLQQYDRWFEFCDSYEAKAHWIVDNSEVPRLFPRSQLPAVRSRVLSLWAGKP